MHLETHILHLKNICVLNFSDYYIQFLLKIWMWKIGKNFGVHFFGCPNYSNSTKKRLDWPLNRHWFWVFPLFFFTLIVLQLMSHKIFEAKLLKQSFIIFATICLMNSPYPMLQIRAGQQSITANLWALTGHIYDEIIIVIGCFSSESFFIIIFRSSCTQKFFKTGIIRNFAIFTGKHPCWSLF